MGDAGNQRCFDNPALLFCCPSYTLGGNYGRLYGNRITHSAILNPHPPAVYTAFTGRLL
jgi:hypothetical protein